MTLSACHCGVRAREGELGEIVIERGPLPGRHRVAGFTLKRETGLPVVRIHGLVVIRRVAARARRRRTGELTAHVARGASHRRMRACQRKRSSLRVIEHRAQPTRRCVTGSAIAWEAGRYVIWIRRAGEIPGMAADTVRRCSLIVPAGVALRAC